MSADHRSPVAETSTAALRLAAVAAVLSLLCGLASVGLLLKTLAAVPALVLGFFSLRRLNALAEESLVPGLSTFRAVAVGGLALGATGLVLGVVGLMSLLLTRTAETGRRAECTNNLRQLGQAVALYHDVHDRRYPQATINNFTVVNLLAPWTAVPCVDRLSWSAALLPYLQRPPEGARPLARRKASEWDALYQRLDPRRPWNAGDNALVAATTVRLLLCPSRPGPPAADAPDAPAPTSYPGIAGVWPGAAELPLGDPRAGFFGYERRLWTHRDNPVDPLPAGTSHTLLAAETTWQTGPWAAGGFSSVRPVDPAQSPLVGLDRPFGGLHPGGANLLMVDGHVLFFSAKGDADVLTRMATLAEDL